MRAYRHTALFRGQRRSDRFGPNLVAQIKGFAVPTHSGLDARLDANAYLVSRNGHACAAPRALARGSVLRCITTCAHTQNLVMADDDNVAAGCEGGGHSLLRHLHEARLLAQGLRSAPSPPTCPTQPTENREKVGEGGDWEVAACEVQAGGEACSRSGSASSASGRQRTGSSPPLSLFVAPQRCSSASRHGAQGGSENGGVDTGGAEELGNLASAPRPTIHLLPVPPDTPPDAGTQYAWEWEGEEGGRLGGWERGKHGADSGRPAQRGWGGAGWGGGNMAWHTTTRDTIADNLRVQEKIELLSEVARQKRRVQELEGALKKQGDLEAEVALLERARADLNIISRTADYRARAAVAAAEKEWRKRFALAGRILRALAAGCFQMSRVRKGFAGLREGACRRLLAGALRALSRCAQHARISRLLSPPLLTPLAAAIVGRTGGGGKRVGWWATHLGRQAARAVQMACRSKRALATRAAAAWAFSVAQRRRIKARACRMSLMRRACLAMSTLHAWRDFCVFSSALRRQAAGLRKKRRRKTMHRVVTALECGVVEARRRRFIDVKAVEMARRRRDALAGLALALWISLALAHRPTCWKLSTVCAARAARACKRAVWGGWQRILLRRRLMDAGKHQRRACLLLQWFTRAQAMDEIGRKAGKAMRRCRLRQLALPFMGWLVERSRMVRTRAVTRKVVRRWRRGGMCKAFTTWVSWAKRSTELRRTAEKVLMRWCQSRVYRAWSMWRTAFSTWRERSATAKHAMLRGQRLMLRSHFESWAWMASSIATPIFHPSCIATPTWATYYHNGQRAKREAFNAWLSLLRVRVCVRVFDVHG